jgi:hypothetical protein
LRPTWSVGLWVFGKGGGRERVRVRPEFLFWAGGHRRTARCFPHGARWAFGCIEATDPTQRGVGGVQGAAPDTRFSVSGIPRWILQRS